MKAEIPFKDSDGNDGNGNHGTGNHGNGNRGNDNRGNANHGNGNHGNGNHGNGNHGNGNCGNSNYGDGNHGNDNHGNGNHGNGNHGNGNYGNGNHGNDGMIESKSSVPPTLLSSIRSVLFVIGTVVIGFAAFCNSLTWHLQRFWGASGDFWQAQWDKILDKFGDDPQTLWVYGSLSLTFVVYWLFGGIYTILDISNRPSALRRYKVQPGTNEPVDTRALLKVIAQVLFNQIVVGLPVVYLSYHLMKWRGYPPVRELPTFHWVLVEIAIHILFEEIGFYYSHRLLHGRYLYKYIHKQHHQWTAPIAVTAIYCHPLEHIGSNLVPPFIGVFLVGSHVATAWLWFSLAILSTLNAHSGYHLPFFPSPEAHDFHHLKFNQCYGVLGVLDRLHGTDTQFRNSRACARHVMMLSLVPAREAFPDDEIKYNKSK